MHLKVFVQRPDLAERGSPFSNRPIRKGPYSIERGRCIMRNHDFVSDGFLALTAASLVLLCSSLLTLALS